jgi:hypothetical protein
VWRFLSLTTEMGKAWPICWFVACLLYFLHLLASHLTKELMMNNVHIVIGCFTVLMCAMSLAASYYEAKEKSKADSEDTGL